MPRKNDSAAALSEPMAMQPAIAHQNGRGLWLYKRTLRRRISDFFSSATKSLPRWLFADAEIRRWNASAAGLDLLQRSACRYGLSPAAIRQLSKRASQKERLSTRRCCKCCAVIVRRAGLPCTPMTVMLNVCHAWGNPTLTLCSAGLTALTTRVSVSTLCARV